MSLTSCAAKRYLLVKKLKAAKDLHLHMEVQAGTTGVDQTPPPMPQPMTSLGVWTEIECNLEKQALLKLLLPKLDFPGQTLDLVH